MLNIMHVFFFSATWCVPCKSYKPVVLKVLREAGIGFDEIDVDENPAFAQVWNILSIPTIIITDEGGYGEYDRIVGAFPEGKLKERVEAAIGQMP